MKPRDDKKTKDALKNLGKGINPKMQAGETAKQPQREKIQKAGGAAKPVSPEEMKKGAPPTTEKVEKEVRKDLPAATVDKNRAAMFSPIKTNTAAGKGKTPGFR